MYTGRDIARQIPVEVVYGVERTGPDSHRLVLDHDVPRLRSRQAFPSGMYD